MSRGILCDIQIASGGAGSEAWNRVSVIAPVKKFGRARLSTGFVENKHGGLP